MVGTPTVLGTGLFSLGGLYRSFVILWRFGAWSGAMITPPSMGFVTSQIIGWWTGIALKLTDSHLEMDDWTTYFWRSKQQGKSVRSIGRLPDGEFEIAAMRFHQRICQIFAWQKSGNPVNCQMILSNVVMMLYMLIRALVYTLQTSFVYQHMYLHYE